jgi:DNA topoisomerase-1
VYRRGPGQLVRDAATLARIRRLAIPPAWTDVWICPDRDGHVQAWGRDAAGRKQYRYHSRWRDARDTAKYARLLRFADRLPHLRARVSRDLRRPGLARAKVLATIVHLLEATLIRVGNEEYARHNGSFGLTTMRSRHVDVGGTTVRFEFPGKGGRRHVVGLTDRRLARVIRGCQELPGQELFQYVDDDGHRRDVTSADVNAYIREVVGAEFSAKDFRTWAGTVLAARSLRGFALPRTATEARRNVRQTFAAVAGELRNTPAVCRTSYVHPLVVDLYLRDGRLAGPSGSRRRGLRPEELALVRILRKAGPGRQPFTISPPLG